jgi:hypothetical protein
MTMQVTIRTRSDADWITALRFTQPVPPYDAERAYLADEYSHSGKRVWKALAPSTGVTPGSDGTKWEAAPAPGRDLTGSTLKLMARAPAVNVYAPLSVTSEEGGDIEITDAATGAVTLKLPKAQLAVMSAGSYDVSMIEITATGEHLPVMAGKLIHSIGPTR